jgi:hypothetical protein
LLGGGSGLWDEKPFNGVFMINYTTSGGDLGGPRERGQQGVPDILLNITKLPTVGAVFERYLLTEIAGEVLPDSRCVFCMKSIVPGRNGVSVIYSAEHSRASYGNLMTCGSIWLCAVCAAKISEKRRVELVQLVGCHFGGLAMITFTLQHELKDSLSDTLGKLKFACGKIFEGDFWTRFKLETGYIGCVKAREMTWSPRNGWHPHMHDLFFFEQIMSKSDVECMQRLLTDRYLYLLGKAGGTALPGLAVDVRVAERSVDIVAEYVAKWDKLPSSSYWGIESEITKSFVKRSKSAKGLTFWQLLKIAGQGDCDAVKLVREYSKAIKGMSSLAYSKGLKSLLKGEFLTDQDLTDQVEEGGVEMAFLAREIWRQVCKKQLRGQLLIAAGTGNTEDLIQFLASNDINLPDL